MARVSWLARAPPAPPRPPAVAFQQRTTPRPNPRLEQYKREALQDVDARAQFTQQMVDQLFSFGELGFQEFETSKYLVNILKQNGFTVQEGVAGIPTAWVATWGSGKPVIALGSDIDGIPQAPRAARAQADRARRAGAR